MIIYIIAPLAVEKRQMMIQELKPGIVPWRDDFRKNAYGGVAAVDGTTTSGAVHDTSMD